MKRVNMQFDEEMLTAIDDFATKMHISRSSAINVMISQFLVQRDSMAAMIDIASALNKLPDSAISVNK